MIDIYLDQNHWIYLARACHGNPVTESHGPVSKLLADGVAAGSVRLPVSLVHLLEQAKPSNAGRRQRLASILDRYNRAWFLAPWTSVLPRELVRTLIRRLQADIPTPPEPEVIGKGLHFGAGSCPVDLSPEQARSVELGIAFLSRQPDAIEMLTTFPNEGGRTRQNATLSQKGETYAQAAEAYRVLAKPFPCDVRHRAVAAQFTLDLKQEISVALTQIGKTWDELFALGERLSDLFSDVPTLDVVRELTLYRDRQWSRRIQPNDLSDVWHLAVSIPYCQVVLVERFWGRALEETRLADKYGTTVCTNLSQIPDALAA